jgi:hypothetical protein
MSLPLEPAWLFYPKYLAETLRKQFQWASLFLRSYLILRRVISDPRRHEYNDLAITPVTEDEIETHEMFNSTEARNYVVKIQRAEKLRRGVSA